MNLLVSWVVHRGREEKEKSDHRPPTFCSSLPAGHVNIVSRHQLLAAYAFFKTATARVLRIYFT
jgi:hypothetical protein